MLSVRPKVAELTFRVFGRALHPELLQVYRSRRVERAAYSAKIEITSAGHVVTWQAGTIVLAEVAAASHHPLPQRRQLISHRLIGSRQDSLDCRNGVRYQTEFELETVRPEVFFTLQQQLSGEDPPEGLFHPFESSGRMALGGISLVQVEARARAFRVRAVHTFPDDYAVVKVESRFSLA